MQHMNKFIKRLLIFFIPLLILGAATVGSFYLLDPFKILNDYGEFNNSLVAYNEDYVATERFLKNKDKYNSFILGSSRAGVGFNTDVWKKKLEKNDNAFSYTASNESIFGIVGKLRLIDEVKGRLDNVLLVIDLDRTFKKTINSNGHLYIKHPRVSNESQKAFTYEYLQDYIFTGFFVAYLDYKIFGIERGYMDKFLIFKNKNQEQKYVAFNVLEWEHHIESNTDKYYEDRKDIFYKRNGTEQVHKVLIQSKSKEYLNEIKNIFDTYKTHYKVVISPLYDQKKINVEDLNTLNLIFGAENVFNFSGKNSITEDIQNYYEDSHYRVHIGSEIVEEIYK